MVTLRYLSIILYNVGKKKFNFFQGITRIV